MPLPLPSYLASPALRSLPLFTQSLRTIVVTAVVCVGATLAVWATSGASAYAQTTPPSASAGQYPYGQRLDAQQWLQAVAQRHGISPVWLQAQLAQARFLPQVPRLMTPPAITNNTTSTARDWRSYRSRFIDSTRIRAGVRFWNRHAATLQRAEKIYGVPAPIIVGIIGVETVYGQQMGNLRVLDSLATLAFDFPQAHPRAEQRQAYFQGELEQFLLTAWKSGSDPSQPKGSYAGAMGLGQFMPTSWERWAVDFDGDGRIDLFNSPADAIGSVANYFRAHGWQAGQPVWYAPLFNPQSLDLATLLAPDILPSFSAAQMAALGVIPKDAMQHDGLLALVELQNGSAAPSYIVGTQNFYTITRYNWSSYYALAVHDLGQEVAAARHGTAAATAQPVGIP